MLKSSLDGYELHQNIINYSVSVVKDNDTIKYFNPRKWLSTDEAKEILAEEINEIRKSE